MNYIIVDEFPTMDQPMKLNQIHPLHCNETFLNETSE
jgi:hypothetical protein